MSYDRLPDRVAGPMNEYQSTTLRKLSIEAYQPKLFAEDILAFARDLRRGAFDA